VEKRDLSKTTKGEKKSEKGKKKKKEEEEEENLTSFDGWAWLAKGGGSSVGDGRRLEITTGAENGGDLRRNGGNGSVEIGEC
jgi:hypothetical protein